MAAVWRWLGFTTFQNEVYMKELGRYSARVEGALKDAKVGRVRFGYHAFSKTPDGVVMRTTAFSGHASDLESVYDTRIEISLRGKASTMFDYVYWDMHVYSCKNTRSMSYAWRTRADADGTKSWIALPIPSPKNGVIAMLSIEMFDTSWVHDDVIRVLSSNIDRRQDERSGVYIDSNVVYDWLNPRQEVFRVLSDLEKDVDFRLDAQKLRDSLYDWDYYYKGVRPTAESCLNADRLLRLASYLERKIINKKRKVDTTLFNRVIVQIHNAHGEEFAEDSIDVLGVSVEKRREYLLRLYNRGVIKIAPPVNSLFNYRNHTTTYWIKTDAWNSWFLKRSG